MKTDLQKGAPAAPQDATQAISEEPQERTSCASVRQGGIGRPLPGPLPPRTIYGSLGPEL